MVLTAMAAGMGWGIRGQYGHETGAMIAGALASLTLVLFLVPRASSLTGARAAAMMTAAIGIGGSMTYGQTVGLTHDGELLGHTEALRWGLLGLFIKGGLWIGFGGAFLGMGLGGKRYRPFEIARLMAGLVALMFLGFWLINSPFDPANKELPAIYFSDDWYFEPDRDLKPRREMWGGYVLALAGLAAYVRWVRHDRLAFRMAGIGVLSGGFGFAGGQSVQAFHAWHPEVFADGGALGLFAGYFGHFNWWNMMETTFGAIWGAGIALGLWLNRGLIAVGRSPAGRSPDEVVLSPPIEVLLIVVHLGLMLAATFLPLADGREIWEVYIEYGPILVTLPMIGIVGGRLWPYAMLLPIVAAPIAGKTVRMMCYRTDAMHPIDGWLLLVELPLAIALVAATWAIGRSTRGASTGSFAAVALLFISWIFFGLNTVFFDYAWPWREWTGRTPNQLIFTACTLSLTAYAVARYVRRPEALISSEGTVPSRPPPPSSG